MNKNYRVYLEEPVERFVEGVGWTTATPTKKQTVLQVSLKYYDMRNGEVIGEGTEDFTVGRLQQIRKTHKLQLTDIKVFHKSPTAKWTPSKTQYKTIKTIYTYSDGKFKDIQAIISMICSLKYDLLKTRTL